MMMAVLLRARHCVLVSKLVQTAGAICIASIDTGTCGASRYPALLRSRQCLLALPR